MGRGKTLFTLQVLRAFATSRVVLHHVLAVSVQKAGCRCSSSIGIVALAVIFAGAAWQAVRAEDAATQHAGNSASCARSTFRVLIDVGHTATSPGADSARGVPEYDFNLKLADVIAQSLHEAGFDKTVRLITNGAKLPSLFERATRANNVHADLFIAIHHDSVPDNLKEAWQYEGKKNYYCDRFSGYAIFVSNDNADRAGSLAFGHLLGQELQKLGLQYTPHYTFALMGRYRHELVDADAGVYRYDHLIVLRSTSMPAVLLEVGSIVNRQEELELATPERRLMVAKAVTAAVENFCASPERLETNRLPSNQSQLFRPHVAPCISRGAARGLRLYRSPPRSSKSVRC
jgi:N-acetylmuramoyl-L-alanine amidase